MDRRTHLVLVPGFAGFDALGQLEYYSNVTQIFHQWQEKREGHGSSTRGPADRASLHYFQSFPTAGVATRARFLEAYLARRCARNEFQRDDTVVLIGHSTGGLDIRQLLSELTLHEDDSVHVDGDSSRAWAVRVKQLLQLIRRVVFISVPQRGANIADHVGCNRFLAAWMVAGLRIGFHTFHARMATSLLKATERWDERLRSELLMAVRDALLEVAQRRTSSPFTAAKARTAQMQIKLWLSHMGADFLVIDDLRTQGDDDGMKSVARFTDEERAAELARLDRYDVETRSYATIGRCPFDEPRLRRGEAPSWPETFFPPTDPTGAEIFYRIAYKLCIAGTLGVEGRSRARVLGSGELRDVEPWENDGVVNTASMLWPDGEDTRLITGDHADIIGHYRRAEDLSARWFDGNDPLAEPQRYQRKYHTYDMFGSCTPFGDEDFQAAWEDILDFSVGVSPRDQSISARM